MRRVHGRRSLVMAGLVLLAAIAAYSAMVVANAIVGTGFPPAPAGAGPAGASARGTVASAGPPSAAPAPVEVPQASVQGLRWVSYHGVELPASPQAGPRDTAGGLASGYADTPLGALLAAVNIAVRANAQWGPGVYGPTIRRQVTGPDAAALLAGCQAAYGPAASAARVPAGQPLGNVYVSEEAFRWVAYTPLDATVDIVTAGPGTQGLTARDVTRIEVVWEGGDWKAVAPPGGDWGNAATVLAVPGLPAEYTPFPGQG
jgi:hypothetical protein